MKTICPITRYQATLNLGEAISVAREAAAQCTVLTHFSQRYPKAVATTGTGTGTGTATKQMTRTGDDDAVKFEKECPGAEGDAAANTAFDGMRVRWDRLRDLPETMRRVNVMFSAHEEERAAQKS